MVEDRDKYGKIEESQESFLGFLTFPKGQAKLLRGLLALNRT